MAEPVLALSGVHAGYGATEILRGVDLTVGQGEIVAVLGSNGAGKSTLNRTISGVMRAWRGAIRFEGAGIERERPAAIVARGLIHVPEGRRIFPNMTVRENLDLGAHHLTPDERDAQITWLYELFPILRARESQAAGTLSGGEQQMLTIARALMMKPKLLILDEPTLGLAPIILEQISHILERLRQTTSISVLLGEQNVTFALPHADRVYVLEHAHIVWEGSPSRFAAEAGSGYL